MGKEKLTERVCQNCHKEFIGEKRRSFCSIRCSSIKNGFQFGHPAWNNGKTHRVRESGEWKHSEESKRKISETRKKRIASGAIVNFNVGKVGNTGRTRFKKGKTFTKEELSKILHRRNRSSLEIKFQGIIDRYELPYRFVGNGEFFLERKNPDFVNTNGAKIAVEVYARKHKEKFRGGIDKWKMERQIVFSRYGWKIVFIEEWQLNKKHEQELLSLLSEKDVSV